MGCCVKENTVIKSSNIPLSHQDSLENENGNHVETKPNINPNIVIPKGKLKSNKISEFIIQNGKNKTHKKNLKSMNALKELSYNEVYECTRYF